MKNIQALYTIAGFQIIIAMLPNDFLDNGSLVTKLVLQIITIFLAYDFIKKDAISRKLSKNHALWGILSPFGIFIYHFFYARKNGIKK